MTRYKLPMYTNSEMANLIDEYIHDERHRVILKRRLIDGATFDTIEDELFLSDRRVKEIVAKGIKILIPILEARRKNEEGL